MQLKRIEKVYNNRIVQFSKELEEKIDRELEKVKRMQEVNENRTYTQEEVDAIILRKDYIETI